MELWTWKPRIFILSRVLIKLLNYARHLENNDELDGLCLHETYIQIFFSILLNPRPTNVTSVEAEYRNLNSGYPQREMRNLTCTETCFLNLLGRYRINKGPALPCSFYMTFIWYKVQRGNASELQLSIVLKKLNHFLVKMSNFDRLINRGFYRMVSSLCNSKMNPFLQYLLCQLTNLEYAICKNKNTISKIKQASRNLWFIVDVFPEY